MSSGISAGFLTSTAPEVLHETMGTKMRRIMDHARISSPYKANVNYIKALPAWQPSLAVKQYQAYVSGGNIYVYWGSATTAVVASAPTSVSKNGLIVDGGAGCFYQGPNVVTVDPLMTITTWAQGQTVVQGAFAVVGGPAPGNPMYCCNVGGTTLGSGTGPSGTGVNINDNGVIWNYYGVWKANPYADDFPTITFSTTTTNSSQYQAGSGLFSANGVVMPQASGAGHAANDIITFDNVGSAFYLGQILSIVAAGSNYAANDTGYVNGGTYSKQAKYKVITISGSGVATVQVLDCGVYSVAPSGTLTTTAITGSGTGFTLTASYSKSSTGTTAISVKVLTVDGNGQILTAAINNAGSYSAVPSAVACQMSTTGTGTGATFYIGLNDPYWCKLFGCTNFGGYGNSLFAFVGGTKQPPGLSPDNLHIGMGFYTDTDTLSLFQSGAAGTAPYAIYVGSSPYDMTPYSIGSVYATGTSWSAPYITINFSGGLKRRYVKIETSAPLPSVYVPTYATVWAPDSMDIIRMATIGDSIVWQGTTGASAGPWLSGNSTTLRLAYETGFLDSWDDAFGGTGWANPGQYQTYLARIPQVIAQNPQIINIIGSSNDESQSAATVTANVTAGLTAIRAALPNCIINLFGVWSNGAAALGVENAIYAGFQAFTDPANLTTYNPVYLAAGGPWITGSWDNNPYPLGYGPGGSASANNAQYLYNSDGTHPVDRGTIYLAKRMAWCIRQQAAVLA